MNNLIAIILQNTAQSDLPWTCFFLTENTTLWTHHSEFKCCFFIIFIPYLPTDRQYLGQWRHRRFTFFTTPTTGEQNRRRIEEREPKPLKHTI